ncbi:MAG: hypothetical protein ACE5D3_03700 [Candidatus Binatia bacterium]
MRGAARIKIAGIVAVVGVSLVTAVMVLLGTFAFHEQTADSKPVVPPYDIFWCSKDEHCAVVDRIGCCPCDQGGAQAAVTTWHRDNLRRFLKSACRPQQVCVQVDLCRSRLEARCVDRKCRIFYEEEGS